VVRTRSQSPGCFWTHHLSQPSSSPADFVSPRSALTPVDTTHCPCIIPPLIAHANVPSNATPHRTPKFMVKRHSSSVLWLSPRSNDKLAIHDHRIPSHSLGL
jgi:hypothetical protein